MEINDIELNYEVVKPEKLRNKIDIRIIENIVCSYFKVSQKYLFQRNRRREIMEKRQIFHYLCVKYTAETLAKIGDYEGFHYGHAVVINSNKQINNLIDTDKKFKQTIYDLELEVRKAQVIFLNEDDFRTVKYNLSRDIINCKSYLDIDSLLVKYMVNNS